MFKTKTEIAFTGFIEPAQCECHKGQFMVVACIIHPIMGRQSIGNKAFQTEKEAEDNLAAFVQKAAFDVLEEAGLDPKDATKIEITHDDEAVKSELRVMRENNVNLH